MHKKLVLFFFFWLISFAAALPAADLKENISKIPATANLEPVIILDAGHGGWDQGAKVHSLFEKRITLATTFYTKKHLEELGYKVILTRTRDTYVSLQRRVAIANRTKANLFVSIHYNASKSKTAKGVEIYYCQGGDVLRSKASKRLAQSILGHLLNQTEALSRGVKEGRFHVIRETDMPAVLVEGGFVTNVEERLLLRDRDYLKKIAKGIALGIDKYLKY